MFLFVFCYFALHRNSCSLLSFNDLRYFSLHLAECSESQGAISEQLQTTSESSEDKTSNTNTHTYRGASQCPQEGICYAWVLACF